MVNMGTVLNAYQQRLPDGAVINDPAKTFVPGLVL